MWNVLTNRTVLACLLVLALTVDGTSEMLPKEGLEQARSAEQQLKANKPEEAIKILLDIDHKYPGCAAVNLRIAQIYDQLNQPAAALFHFRRYIRIAGDKALPDARARAITLEKTAGAADVATEFAVKLGEPAEPVGAPVPVVTRSLAKVGPDGTLLQLRGPEDFSTTGGVPVSRPATSPIPQLETPSAQPNDAMATSTPAVPVDSALAAASAPGGVEPTATPAVVPRGRFTPPPIADPSAAPMVTDVTPSATPIATFRSQAPTSLPEPTRAAMPTAIPRRTTQPTRFFQVTRVGGEKAVLRIQNSFPGSLMTFSAVPEGGGEPVNAIMTAKESRTINVVPGKYKVTVNVSDTAYAPAPILNSSYEITFEAGNQYSRTYAPSGSRAQ